MRRIVRVIGGSSSITRTRPRRDGGDDGRRRGGSAGTSADAGSVTRNSVPLPTSLRNVDRAAERGDDAVADRQPEPGADADRLVVKNGVKIRARRPGGCPRRCRTS